MSSSTTETRTRILKAALYLLESSQGKGVRMSDVAKRAQVSRQAIYLHFETRAALLIATTHYLDDLQNVQERLIPSRTAKTGVIRLNNYIEAWTSYIPEIYGISKALLAMSDTDEEAAAAWRQRMQDMREGCAAAIKALKSDKMLSTNYSLDQATDILWTILSVRNWEHFTQECKFSQKKYTDTIKSMAKILFVSDGPAK